ncbi:MAG TPA: hypothetical protein H9832_04650 [Candidatus Agathobaculum merdavium]|nr:hypothetical protein [Candidatus Agathobaculum merdavium]
MKCSRERNPEKKNPHDEKRYDAIRQLPQHRCTVAESLCCLKNSTRIFFFQEGNQAKNEFRHKQRISYPLIRESNGGKPHFACTCVHFHVQDGKTSGVRFVHPAFCSKNIEKEQKCPFATRVHCDIINTL